MENRVYGMKYEMWIERNGEWREDEVKSGV